MSELIYSVEDVAEIREIISCALESADMEAETFDNSRSMLERLKSRVPDLILLDIMLPDLDGVETLKILKNSDFKRVPVIMVSAKDAEYDKVKLLNLGACDYMTKPFGVLELIARVKANLKRAAKDIEIYGEYRIDSSQHIIMRGDEELNLTVKEYDVLAMLLRNKGNAVDKQEILDNVWGEDYEGEMRTLNMVILRLRGKLGESAIETVRGIGFRLR